MEVSYAGPAQREVTTKLKTLLVVNDAVIPLNGFTQRYMGTMLRGIAESLGFPGKKVNLYINPDELKIFSDETEVPIRKEFVRFLIESTVKGILSPLKGIFWLEKITISTE